MPKTTALIIGLTMDRETKNTVRFAEDGDLKIIDKMYVKKTELAKLGDPKTLKVTVEPGE